MASIYRRTGRKCWYVTYFPEPHKAVTVKGSTDYKATEALARQLETAAFERSKGIIDASEETLARHGARPIGQHLDDFEAVLRGRGRTPKHVQQTQRLVQAVLDGCGFAKALDLNAAKVSAFLADLKGKGRSARWLNAHVTAVRAFSRWLFQNGRARVDPMLLVAKLNAKADPRRRRRALEDAELSWLLAATAAGPIRYRMAGADRAMLYRVAVETGLRSSELRSLSVGSFDVADLADATVTVQAAYSKRRRDDTIPLRRETATVLAAWVKGKPTGERAFRMPNITNVSRMFRADLEAANIPTQDADGRVADFHGLRHCFITRLARAGVHPKTAQLLARHSTITLTLDHYTHSIRGDERRALEQLPGIQGPAEPEWQTVRATGTENLAARVAAPVAARRGPEAAKPGNERHIETAAVGESPTEVKPTQNAEKPTFEHSLALSGNAGQRRSQKWAQQDSNTLPPSYRERSFLKRAAQNPAHNPTRTRSTRLPCTLI